VHARFWRDALSKDDLELSLRGSSSSRSSKNNARPGELRFETEEDPFYFPSSNEADSVNYYNEDNDAEIDKGEREESTGMDVTTSSTAISGFKQTSVTENTIQVSKNFAEPNSRPDNLSRQSIFSNVSNKRDIDSYRTSRDFVAPTESPASSASSSTGTYNLPTVSPTEEAARYAYPENSVAPMQNPPWGYFNYDTSEESWYGPGYPVISNIGGDLVVEYTNNGWMDYVPPPPIPPNEAMAIANGVTSAGGHKNYFYWDEFGPEGLGFGPWKDTLRILRNDEHNNSNNNQCGNVGMQSPIDIRPTGVACLEHHQIRSRKGDFRVFGTRDNLDLSIMPSKLRVGVRRRPCKYLDNPVCSEPDPPHADFPHGWPGFSDVIHVDFKLPAEHRIYGRDFDGEMQIYHLHPGRRRLPVVSVLMKVSEQGEIEDDGDAGHNEYLQEAIDGFQYEYDANRAKCAKAAIDRENRRLQMGYETKKSNVDSEWDQEQLERRCNAARNQTPMSAGDGSFEADDEEETQGTSLEDCRRSKGKHGGDDNEDYDRTIEELVNASYEGNRTRLEEFATFVEQDSGFAIQKDNHRRRLAGIWDPHHESLVPSIYFYGYEGSLTEPPCSEIVSWFVIDEPMTISRNQLEHMKFLLFTNVDETTCQSTSVHHRSSVARPIQDTGSDRQIWHCTPNDYLPD
jgi:carbonic anhydrase